jgi:hypothetical protein
LTLESLYENANPRSYNKCKRFEESLKFYRGGLGLRTNGIVGTEFERASVVFFDLRNEIKFALRPRKEVAATLTKVAKYKQRKSQNHPY